MSRCGQRGSQEPHPAPLELEPEGSSSPSLTHTVNPSVWGEGGGVASHLVGQVSLSASQQGACRHAVPAGRLVEVRWGLALEGR